jgi:hypothetical protein
MLRSSSAPARCLRRAYAAVRAPARRGHLRTQAIATRVSADADAPAAPPAPPARKKLPAFDYTALVASVAEIRALAVPTKVEVAVQADAYTLVLGLRGLEGKTALHVSWHPDAARVSLGPPPPRVHKTENLSFGEQAQAVLRNLILVEAVVPEPWERVAVFGFAARPGDAVAFRLHVETQGRNSNAVLTQVGARADRGKKTADPGGDDPTFADKIVACAYQVGSSQTSVRPLSPGFAYQPPPPAPGVAPDAFGDGACADRETFREAVTVAAATAPKKQSRAKKKNEAERTDSDTSGHLYGRRVRVRSGWPGARVARGLPRARAVVAQGRGLRRRRRRRRSLRQRLGRDARRVDGVGANDFVRRVVSREARRNERSYIELRDG